MKSSALFPSNLPSVIDTNNDPTNILFTLFVNAVSTGRLGVLPIRIYRGNNAVYVSVDVIGEQNQVILE